jgi:hypothetical protein
VLGVLLPLALLAPDCFGAGLAAYGRADYPAALDVFVSASQRPECAGEPLMALNLARTHQALAESDGDRTHACSAARWYRSFLAQELPDPLRTVGAQGRDAMQAECDRPEPLPPPPGPPPVEASGPAQPTPEPLAVRTRRAPRAPSRVLAWLSTGGALVFLATGTTLMVLAGGDADDAAAAVAQQRSAPDEPSYRAAVSDARMANDSAQTNATLGYVMLGAGAATGGLAAWLWLRGSESPVAVVPTPDGLRLIGRW